MASRIEIRESEIREIIKFSCKVFRISMHDTKHSPFRISHLYMSIPIKRAERKMKYKNFDFLILLKLS